MRFEKIFVSMAAISLIMMAFKITGGPSLFLLSTWILSVFYFFLSVPVFLNLRGRAILDRSRYKGVDGWVVVIMILSGWALSSLVLASTFLVLGYVGGQSILFAALIFEVPLIIAMTMLRDKVAKEHYRAFLMRVLPWAAFGLACLFAD